MTDLSTFDFATGYDAPPEWVGGPIPETPAEVALRESLTGLILDKFRDRLNGANVNVIATREEGKPFWRITISVCVWILGKKADAATAATVAEINAFVLSEISNKGRLFVSSTWRERTEHHYWTGRFARVTQVSMNGVFFVPLE